MDKLKVLFFKNFFLLNSFKTFTVTYALTHLEIRTNLKWLEKTGILLTIVCYYPNLLMKILRAFQKNLAVKI
jgi:hypothetical protein